ncbi:hypothetical protein C8A05DRAFT_18606 [Staphylotrichum tortipilum]|uniref:C3H1-type domain-containing protein n=1 Tax=Staphylotrichum tortipilum TaxID=2831512 RepID=A0AAN6RQB2_9PEZI|nr:hypothetical protein C8A05DRAFT_18606 [Staphylotrichum longicolle]
MNRYDPPEGPDPAQAHAAALQTWENMVHDRHRIEHDLSMGFRDLLTRYREKCAECEREKRNAMIWEKEQRMSERELNSLKTAAESSPFAFVVVDGDGAVFREDLIAMGEEGGRQAAHQLHQQLKDYFLEHPHLSNIDTVFVHVVLSVEGLSRALIASGVLPTTDHTALTRFGRGFCRAQPLFSFTDVGYGKEQADHKIRKLFEVMEKNIQCRSLILAGCHDNGYATFLESFRGNQKITLLETTPAAADFRKFTFKRISFPHVFRSDPVPSRQPVPQSFAPVAPVMAAPPPGFQNMAAPPPGFQNMVTSTPALSPPNGNGPNRLPTPPAAMAPSKPDATPNSYATIGRGTAPITINIASTKRAPAARPFYQLNKDDERVDVQLAKADSNAVKSLEDRRQMSGMNLCNKYHLANACKNNNCNFYHGDRLNPAEMLALRHKTRNLVCNSGHKCREIGCNLGHHCSNPGSCYFGDDCRFHEMHGMDITPTIKIYEDGTREVV